MPDPSRTLRSRVIYSIVVLIFCLGWASGFTVAKLAVQTCPPAIFGGIRFLTTGALLLAFAGWRGELRKPVPWGALCVLGVLNQAGYQGLAWQGMGTVSAGVATIIVSLNPILVAAIAAMMLREKLHWRKILGLLLGFAGAVFVVRHRIAGGAENPVGLLLVTGALLSLVAGTIAFKVMAPAVTLTVAVGVQAATAGVVLLTMGLGLEDRHAVLIGPQFWLTMTYCVLILSICNLMLWFWLLRNGTASSASALHFLIPPIGLAISWLALGEQISVFDLAGVVPVALGIWLATRAPPLRQA